MDMIFHQIATTQGCQSYLLGCRESHAAIIIDPEITLVERYLGLTAREGLRLHYLLDTHTHADHFSAGKHLARQLQRPLIMHRNSPAPFVDMAVDDGEIILVGKLRLEVLHTPGHTADSICLLAQDRLFSGDTLLIGATGRTDLPTGDPAQLYHSLFDKILTLDPRLLVYPAHIYSNRHYSTLGEELANNPRLQYKEEQAFIEQMRALDLKMPTHLTEALRTNLSGGKTVNQFLAEAAEKVTFMAMEEVARHLEADDDSVMLLDVREKDAFQRAHIPGAMNIPRGQLELLVNSRLPDPTKRIVVCCQYGKISTLAAATLKEMGFTRAVALEGGMEGWCNKGLPTESQQN